MKQRVRKHDLVCLALLLVLLAVMAVGAPYAQTQRVERFNIVPELVVSFVVRPCMLLLLGYSSAWGLAGFFREEPRLRPGAHRHKRPMPGGGPPPAPSAALGRLLFLGVGLHLHLSVLDGWLGGLAARGDGFRAPCAVAVAPPPPFLVAH